MERMYTDPVVNLLPFDGAADYYGRVLTAAEARHYLDVLLRLVEWRNDEAGIFGRTFNSCLLNLYHTGDEGMAWHSDDEKTLEPGSLLVMHGVTQTHWMHALPKTKKVMLPRVNLTFRTMVGF